MSDSERLIIIEHNFHDVYSNSNIYKKIFEGGALAPLDPPLHGNTYHLKTPHILQIRYNLSSDKQGMNNFDYGLEIFQ